MAAYAVGMLHELKMHDDILAYLQQIDSTLALFGGRFIVHGAKPMTREGQFDAQFVVIEFPDLESAKRWYDSPQYQAIIPLRADHSNSTVFLVDGVVEPHAAVDVLTPGLQ